MVVSKFNFLRFVSQGYAMFFSEKKNSRKSGKGEVVKKQKKKDHDIEKNLWKTLTNIRTIIMRTSIIISNEGNSF